MHKVHWELEQAVKVRRLVGDLQIEAAKNLNNAWHKAKACLEDGGMTEEEQRELKELMKKVQPSIVL